MAWLTRLRATAETRRNPNSRGGSPPKQCARHREFGSGRVDHVAP